MLLKSYSDIEVLDHRTDGSWKLLHLCCFHGTSVDIVEYLLLKGVGIEDFVLDGTTALMYAIERGHDHLVRCLLSHGAKVNSVDQYNKTPLHRAVRPHRSGILRLLLEHGADHTVKTDAGETLLHFAAYDGDLEGLKTLQSFNLDGINVQDCITDFNQDQKSKGLIGLPALQIAEQREHVIPEWMDAFHQLIRGIEHPESWTRMHGVENDLDVFEDALEHQNDPSLSWREMLVDQSISCTG